MRAHTPQVAFHGGSVGKEDFLQRRRHTRCGFDPWVGQVTLEKEMAACSRVVAWEIPWTEEPHGLQFKGSQRVGHDYATARMHITGKWGSAAATYAGFRNIPSLDDFGPEHQTCVSKLPAGHRTRATYKHEIQHASN